MGVNGKQKGASYERYLAPFFAEWSHSEVKRVPLSGGWQKEAKFDVKNDLVSTDRFFPIGVEAKKREGWMLEHILINEGCPIIHSAKDKPSWWHQVLHECPKWRLPVLVFTKNRSKDMVMVRVKGFHLYGGKPLDDVKHFTFSSKETGLVYILSMSDFLSHLPYAKARKTAKRRKKKLNKR